MFILGGINGNTTSADMDHFDDSVIIHEYAHFIEDVYGSPNSPGGSHNGNSIIDPRLAWGEGWSNFFQAAVTGNPRYRDTYGHEGCSGNSCTGVLFDESLDPAADATYKDKPALGPGDTAGEGNFREFSIARLLYDVVKASGGVSRFSEIWTVFNGTATNSMRRINDPFKSVGRFHKTQVSLTGKSDWSNLRETELHVDNLSVYGAPLVTTGGCTPNSINMTIVKDAFDDGSFRTSDLFRNNDFYVINHTGGNLSVQVNWSGSDVADLDIYLYRNGYVYGDLGTVALRNDNESSSTSGSATISGNVAAGSYILNIMAYTGLYNNPGEFNTSYSIKLNSTTACPSP
jgi:hypothetical protein